MAIDKRCIPKEIRDRKTKEKKKTQTRMKAREKREGNKKEITRKERGLGMKDKRITRKR